MLCVDGLLCVEGVMCVERTNTAHPAKFGCDNNNNYYNSNTTVYVAP